MVLFTQTESSVLAGTYSLIFKFVLVLLPLLILIFIVIMVLNRMYLSQETTMQQLALRNTQLQQANQVRSDFLANVSHDLRTPLTTMSLALSGLLDVETSWNRSSAVETIKFVSEEIDILEARVRNLLEMSRLDANAQPLRMHEADMTDIVGAALERLQPLLASRPLDLCFPDEPLLVVCDSSQVEIVVLNVLENAVKYSEPDGPLRLVIERQEGIILFAVEDTGVGITPGQETRIFEKFYRGGIGPKQGTGLGLAICKAIIEAHGGEIGAANLPVRGARFWFTLRAS
jgi:two-component system sensor histidine kinase KdpD